MIVVDDSSSLQRYIYKYIFYYIKYSAESENVCLWDSLCKFFQLWTRSTTRFYY